MMGNAKWENGTWRNEYELSADLSGWDGMGWDGLGWDGLG